MVSVKSAKYLCGVFFSGSENFGLSSLAVLLMIMPVLFTGVVSSESARAPWNWAAPLLLLAFVHIWGSGLEKRKGKFLLAVPAIVVTVFFVLVGQASEKTLWLMGIFWAAPILLDVIKKNSLMNVLVVVICILLFQSQWGVTQFVLQEDLGMNILGESKLSADEVGVAKFSMGKIFNDGEGGSRKIVRAYGPFNHPNSMGGVLTIGFLLSCMASLYFGGSNGCDNRGLPLFINVAEPVILLGAVLTFSRAAYLANVLGGLIFLLVVFSNKLLGGGRRLRNKDVFYKMLILSLIVVSLSPLVFYRFIDSEDVALPERQAGWRWAVGIIKENGLWLGSGIGQYSVALKDYLDRKGVVYESWQIDYVHNIPLLIVVEWGAVMGFVLALGCGVLVFKRYGRVWWWLIPLIPLLVLDHYFLTQLYPLVVLSLYLVVLGYWPGRKKRFS